MAELERRLALVFEATTGDEIDELFVDLPVDDEPSPYPAQRTFRRFTFPGVRRFRRDVTLQESPELVYEQALAFMAPMLDTGGLRLVVAQPSSLLRFSRQDGRPASVTVVFLPDRAGGTRLLAFGEAPRAVRRAFARLRND